MKIFYNNIIMVVLTELECRSSGRRFLIVECDVFNAVISELYCTYGDIPGAEEDMCEL